MRSSQYHIYLSLLIALVALLAQSCSNTVPPLKSVPNGLTYDYESSALHPQIIVYHQSEEKSIIYVKLNASELLHTRVAANKPFEAEAEISCAIMSGSATIDTASVILKDQSNSELNYALVKKININLQPGKYTLKLAVKDLRRNLEGGVTMTIDKTDIFNKQNFLVARDTKFEEVIFLPKASTGDTLYVKSERNITMPQLWLDESEIKLPPPPFANTNPELPSTKNATLGDLEEISSGVYRFVVKKGINFLSCDSNAQIGITLISTSVFYPEVKTNNELINPLRYITSRAEFDEIAKSSFSKKLIDNFWIECGGGRTRGKELISSYYGRVEEANLNFTSYTEGWRTDRGMILLAFGQPNRINRNKDSETWIYSDSNGAPQLTFVFTKLSHPYSDNVYVLNRDSYLKPYWEHMVTTWRQGKIFSD